MENSGWISSNWPVLVVAFAFAFVIFGLVKKVVKVAVLASVLAVAALVVWPIVHG